MLDSGTRSPEPVAATLFGRAAELAEMDALIEATRMGNGRVLLLEGPAGIGKSELVKAARERASRRGLTVLAAQGDELESAYAYAVVRQWLERDWALAGDRRGGGDAADLALSPAPTVVPVGDDASFGILHALYLFVSDLSLERPLLLVLDDAHWADPPSLRFVAYLRRRLDGLAVGVIVAARQGAVGPAADLLDGVRDDPAAAVRAVSTLSDGDCAAVLRHAFGTGVGPRFACACRQATGGNPLYLAELQRALAVEGVGPVDANVERVDEVTPKALSRYVLRRLADVGADAPRLAGAISVVGDGGSLRHAARLAGLEPRCAGELARSFVRAAILRTEDPIRFVHPIVRRVIADQLTSVEREDWHLQTARLLLDERAPLERAAGHVLHTRPGARDWCVEALRAAALQAMSRSAPDAAAGYLRRAIVEPPEPRLETVVLRELGAAEAMANDPRAIEHLEQALRGANDLFDRVEITLALTAALLDVFRSVEACRRIEDVLAELGVEHRELRIRLEAALASIAWLEGETVAAGVRVVGRHWDEPPTGGPGRAILAQKSLIMLLTGHPADDVRSTASAALRDAREDDLPATFETAASVLIFAEGFDQLPALLDRIARLRTVHLVRRRVASLETIRGWLALRLGALETAELHLRTGLDLTPSASSPAGWLVVRGLLASVLMNQGKLDESDRVLMAAPEEPWPLHVATTFALAARSGLRFAQHRVAEAVADLEQLAAIERAWALTGPSVHQTRGEAAIAVSRLGRGEEAGALIDLELERARAFGAPINLGSALRAAGVVHGGTRGVELLGEAVSLLDSSPAALECARAHVELGAALRRANQRRLARKHLDIGLRLAQRCGARLLAQRAYDELAASGQRLRPADLEDRDALTPAELRIARHAVDGMTNREIASALYLSIKTVEMHLGRVYRKLGITSRADLADALRQRD